MKIDARILWGLLVMLVMACGGGSESPTPMPNPGDDDGEEFEVDLANCPLNVSNQTLDVMTWNIEQFPKNSLTIEAAEEVIEAYDPDVIAVQEISSGSSFNTLIENLDGWEGTLVRHNSSNLMLGYLYKTSEVTINGDVTQLYEEDTDANNNAFTSFRRPLMLNVTHKPTGLQTYLINIHLKCCNGSEDRRRAATNLIKEYIDTELPDDNVIILGDYNDEIVDDVNVFQVWIDDADNYQFTTMDIANGADTEWSYPSWPSMIDHILITNELFDNEVETSVVTMDRCFEGADYERYLSDHRPVFISLSGD